ncbi:hypothetical protein CGMCC3_g9916 [Colletotrichum fructicola]|uniref:Uncharacterized protein n=1 Tax=Colletotrichum fructicola (strain Nara gc5) TaxID=1213859 RepID=A0A7J6IZU0_COLFN|nr:uncharacterized protein CGMCC3_g9916 [Colletotrichum fructicola]KAE9574108.1 hypothetical protein CGMCC3_g9916 [Colletotrichum fructicola]KAF4482646.1 hypothetical protein CGGC5_v009033 [Colletotrichum fructicola Nara gc5]
MDADSPTCPQDSNSTDCLLRNIVQLLDSGQKADDAKFDWDPLTFVFTLIIGVIALVFALIPIIQVIIAPGQGSRTTNHLAIGKKWSQKRERRWNWHEWTFEYTASTPIFRMETLERWINKDIAKITGDEDFKGQPLCGVNTTARNDTGFTDLEKFAMNRSEEVEKIDENTEHNPDDVRSALVTIFRAMFPWKTSSSRSKEMPAATWIDFFPERAYWQYSKKNKVKEDPCPILGDLGAKWVYNKTTRGKKASSQKTRQEDIQTVRSLSQLRVAMLHARGTIETGKQSLFQTAPPARENEPPFTALNLLNGQHRVQTLKFMLAVSKEQMNASSIQESFILDYGELSQEQYMPVVGLFLASTPRHVPALFPTDSLSKKPPLTTLALNGHYWTEVTSEDVRGDDMSDWPLSLKPPGWGGVQWLKTGMAEIGLINGKSYDKHVERVRNDVDQQLKCGDSETPKVIVLKVVLHLCLKMLHNADTFRTWFVDYSPEARSYLRYIMLLQLELLDRWFLGQPRAHIESRAILICNTTITLMLAANIAFDKEDMSHSTSNTGKGNIWNHHSRTIRWLDDFLKSLGLTDGTLNEAHRSWNIQRSCDRKSLSISAADEPKRNASEGPGETLAPLASQWKPFDSELKRLVCTVYKKEWELFNTHQLLNRLAKVVELGLDQTYRKWRPAQVAGEDQSTKTIDDLVIYRCILVAMLFQTAPDNSDLRRSGLWEQVVAII